MGRGKGTKIVVKNMSSNEDVESLNKMFSQMTGVSDAESDVIVPKISKIYSKIIKFNTLFNILLNVEDFVETFKDYSIWFTEISDFLKNLIESTETDIKKDYEFDTKQFENMSEKDLNLFYKKIKENIYIRKIVITGSNLSLYKKYLSDVSKNEKIDDSFIKREPGLSFQPLAFSTFDLKVIWNSETSEKSKKFVLSILSHVYNIGIDIYDILSSPDVDIRKFSTVLIDSITKMRKQMPRCDQAFDVIENSVKLLEDNFKSYYRSSVEAENPSIIVENFIIDITNTQKTSAVVTAQFKQIVQHLKQKSSQNNDPKVKKLFSMLNNQFNSIDTEITVKKE